MGMAYCDLLADRDMLRLQLQAYAACDDPDIQRVVREEWTALYDSVARASGADDDALHHWFAEGMLMNVCGGRRRAQCPRSRPSWQEAAPGTIDRAPPFLCCVLSER